jgi:hypothetical protein
LDPCGIDTGQRGANEEKRIFEKEIEGLYLSISLAHVGKIG